MVYVSLTVCCLCTGHAELGVFLEPLCLQDRQMVVLAVNNNQSTDHAGGSHWYGSCIIITITLQS